jgi:hypothetical protein
VRVQLLEPASIFHCDCSIWALGHYPNAAALVARADEVAATLVERSQRAQERIAARAAADGVK